MKRRLIATTIIFVSFCWLTHYTILAQHLDDKDIAKGGSDSVLCGIDVYKGTPAQAIAKFGKPTRVIDVPDTPGIYGGREYEWQRGAIRLSLGTFNEKGDDSIAYSIKLSGSYAPGELGKTGRGLKLGATLGDVKKIYGPRFYKVRGESGRLHITIQWGDGTTLDLEFDKNDRINYMHLMASIE